MDPELLLFGILPILLAVGLMIASIRMALRTRRITEILWTAVLVLLTSFSLVMLYRMVVLEAWPTFLPHITLGFCLVLVVGQYLLFHRNRTASSNVKR